MKKKFISIVLSGVMAFAMALSVMADDVTPVDAEVMDDAATVTFVTNDGNDPFSVKIEINHCLHELPFVEKDDKAFVGWFRDEDFKIPFRIKTPIEEDITLYAKLADVMSFEDVDLNTQYFDAISYVYYNDIMKGVEDNLFGPDETLTRAMLVTILYRAAGEPAFMNDLVFTDVEEGSYYEKAVVWANGKDIVKGVSQTEFAPDENVTREQMAAILYRYSQYKEVPLDVDDTNTLSYDDIMDISDYAGEAIHSSLAIGALEDNRTKGMIMPGADATRAEAAKMIHVYNVLPTKYELAVEPKVECEDVVGTYTYKDDDKVVTVDITGTDKDDLKIMIYVKDAVDTAKEWSMTGSLNNEGVISFDSSEKTVYSPGEDGEEVKDVTVTTYDEGNGFIFFYNGEIYITGMDDEELKGCVVPAYVETYEE